MLVYLLFFDWSTLGPSSQVKKTLPLVATAPCALVPRRAHPSPYLLKKRLVCRWCAATGARWVGDVVTQTTTAFCVCFVMQAPIGLPPNHPPSGWLAGTWSVEG